MVIGFEDIGEVRDRHLNQRIVMALGSFDIIHIGHIGYREWAKRQGDVLVVTMKSDEQIAAHKGDSRPLIKSDERVRVVDSLKPVDYALVGAQGGLYDAALATAEALRPDIIVLGPDWGPEVMHKWRKDLPSCDILVAPRQSERSSSEIIDRHNSYKAN